MFLLQVFYKFSEFEFSYLRIKCYSDGFFKYDLYVQGPRYGFKSAGAKKVVYAYSSVL